MIGAFMRQQSPPLSPSIGGLYVKQRRLPDSLLLKFHWQTLHLQLLAQRYAYVTLLIAQWRWIVTRWIEMYFRSEIIWTLCFASVYRYNGRASHLCWPGQVCQGHLQQRLWYGFLQFDQVGLSSTFTWFEQNNCFLQDLAWWSSMSRRSQPVEW